MKYRTALAVVAIGLSSSAVGCFSNDGWDNYGYSDNEIVFGIEQSKNADGKVQTSVGYEFLDVMNHGWNARGFVSAGRSCWAERLDDRLGQPHVDGGVATFQGGALPDKGIAIIANRSDDLVLDAPAWSKGGDTLTFEARGFAMPNIGPQRITAPSLDLAILGPAAASATPASPEGVAIDPKKELEITWTAGDGDAPNTLRESVVASLIAVPAATPDARGVELRCFFPRSEGKGQFPKAIMDRFAALVGGGQGPITGKLRIATHRQLTIFADGGWTVYVVATVDQRTQLFTLPRLKN